MKQIQDFINSKNNKLFGQIVLFGKQLDFGEIIHIEKYSIPSKFGKHFILKLPQPINDYYFLKYVYNSKKSRAIIHFKDELIQVSNDGLYCMAQKNKYCYFCGAKIIGGFLFVIKNQIQIYKNKIVWNVGQIAEKKNNKLVIMTKDHIFPKSKGGITKIENLQPMCEDCNQMKNNLIIKKEGMN